MVSPHPLTSALGKVIRAEEHLASLKGEIGTYIEGQPYLITTDPQVDPPGYAVSVHLRQEPPPILGVLIGDVLQNLRASLDYLARALVVANGGEPGRSTRFPIPRPSIHREDGEEVIDPSPTPGKPPTIGATEGGASPDALAIIEALQPYNRPEATMQIWPDRRKRGIIPQGDRTGDYEFDIGGVSPLYVLNEMAAIDRHRRLNITVPYVGFVTVTWWFADDPTSRSSVLVEGNPLDLSAQLHFIAADRNREVEVNCRGLMEVSVQERPSLGGSLPIVLVLKKLIRFVQIYVFGLLGHCVER